VSINDPGNTSCGNLQRAGDLRVRCTLLAKASNRLNQILVARSASPLNSISLIRLHDAMPAIVVLHTGIELHLLA
jgi:hypothetical protein